MYRVRSTDVWFNLPGVVAAWQPQAAPGPFAARQNVSHDARRAGVYQVTSAAAPTWSPIAGWGFNGSTQYLATGITAENNQKWSLIVEYANQAVGGLSFVAGCNEFGGAYQGIGVSGDWAGTGTIWFNGSPMGLAGQLPSGSMAVAGPFAYKNGIQVSAIAAQAGAFYEIMVGACGTPAGPQWFFSGNIRSVLIVSRVLSAAEVWQASRQMAYCHVNPDWSAWGRRRRYYYAPEQAATVRWRGIGRNDTPVSGRISTGRPI